MKQLALTLAMILGISCIGHAQATILTPDVTVVEGGIVSIAIGTFDDALVNGTRTVRVILTDVNGNPVRSALIHITDNDVAAPAPPTEIGPITKIIFIGDKCFDEQGPRAWTYLSARWKNIDLVGPNNIHNDESYDQDHGCFAGDTTEAMQSKINEILANYPADAYVIDSGTIDVMIGTDIAFAASRVGSVIDIIHSVRPNALVLLCNLTGVPNKVPATDAFNGWLTAIADSNSTFVKLVDLHTGWSTSLSSDGIMPGPAEGYREFDKIWTALTPFLQ